MEEVESPDATSSPTDASGANAQAALSIIADLRAQGHVAYLAGGCVRDRLLGRTPKDYDVATDAPPEKVISLFPRRSRAVGQAFGVVLVKSHHHWIEVATFRKEWGYQDGRRPDHVVFCDAQQDALRRDFTINGLFLDPSPQELRRGSLAEGSGKIVDYVSGQDDLKAKRIRAIGQPEERFSEDYLRLLRAVRFAARFGFDLEPRTEAAIRANARYLGRISRERIGQEIRLMLDGERPTLAARWIEQLHLDAATFNEDHLATELPTLSALDSSADATGRLTAWLLDRHQNHWAIESAHAPDLAQAIGFWLSSQGIKTLSRWRKALCLTNDQSQAIGRILHLLPKLLGWNPMPLAQQKRLLADEHSSAAIMLLKAMRHRPGIASVVQSLDEQVPALLQAGVAPTPWLTGDDLVAMGFPPGPAMGKLLNDLYDRQLDGRLPSPEAAIAWAKSQPS